MQTYINVYERDNAKNAGKLDGIREDAFNYELRYKYYEGWYEGNYALIDWETQAGDETMLAEFFAEVTRYLKYLNFSGDCEIHIYDRDDTFDIHKYFKI